MGRAAHDGVYGEVSQVFFSNQALRDFSSKKKKKKKTI